MDFYNEYKTLVFFKPRQATCSRNAENSVFGDYLFRTKNIYLGYYLFEAEDSFYSEYLSKSRDIVDCSYVTGSELAYECTDCSFLYNCSFLQDCHNCSNCDFSIDCYNCVDCFGCWGLKHREFMIFNKQYAEEEYRVKVAEFKKNTPAKTMEILAPEFLKHPRLYARQLKGGERCYGDYIYFSKNCYWCFNVRNCENCSYVFEVINPEYNSSGNIDCCYATGITNCYECAVINMCSNCNFLYNCTGCGDSEYLINCHGCKNCFGCVNLTNKEYCILNKQCTREEYIALLKQIKNSLKGEKQYGKTLADILK